MNKNAVADKIYHKHFRVAIFGSARIKVNEPAYDEVYKLAHMLGAQNIFWQKQGAFTGEISPYMLVSCGCKYVIIGHSERRELFGETDENINKKIISAINAKLIPILCIGESEAQRDSNSTFDVLNNQLEMGLANINAKDLQDIIIAYEPIWDISIME